MIAVLVLLIALVSLLTWLAMRGQSGQKLTNEADIKSYINSYMTQQGEQVEIDVAEREAIRASMQARAALNQPVSDDIRASLTSQKAN